MTAQRRPVRLPAAIREADGWPRYKGALDKLAAHLAA